MTMRVCRRRFSTPRAHETGLPSGDVSGGRGRERGTAAWSAAALWVVALATALAPTRTTLAHDHNALTESEKNAGWRLLFDGASTKGWRGYRSQAMPASWRIEEGALVSRREKGATAGDIITEEQFGDFELAIEWKMTPGNNSGIAYRATEEYDNMFKSGPEYQILDNAFVNPNVVDGLNPLSSAGACYAVIPPVKDVTRPVGEWNKTRIKAVGKHVEHWLNDEKIVEYDVGSPAWTARVKTSRYCDSAYGKSNWGRAEKGHIGLQDYGGGIAFRAIKIRPLPADAP